MIKKSWLVVLITFVISANKIFSAQGPTGTGYVQMAASGLSSAASAGLSMAATGLSRAASAGMSSLAQVSPEDYPKIGAAVGAAALALGAGYKLMTRDPKKKMRLEEQKKSVQFKLLGVLDLSNDYLEKFAAYLDNVALVEKELKNYTGRVQNLMQEALDLKKLCQAKNDNRDFDVVITKIDTIMMVDLKFFIEEIKKIEEQLNAEVGGKKVPDFCEIYTKQLAQAKGAGGVPAALNSMTFETYNDLRSKYILSKIISNGQNSFSVQSGYLTLNDYYKSLYTEYKSKLSLWARVWNALTLE